MTLLLWLASPLHAATLHVGAGGYATLGEAVAAASSGDTLTVDVGTWTDALVTGGKSLTVVGVGGASATVLAPPSGVDAVTVTPGDTLTLRGFTLAPTGGRGVVVEGADAELDDIAITGAGDAVGVRGAGLFADGATVAMSNVSFSDGTATYGGHVFATGGSLVTGSDLQFTGGSATRGGALLVEDASDVQFARVVASSPAASEAGGFAWVDAASLAVDDLDLDGPSAVAFGGAFALSSAAELNLVRGDARNARVATTGGSGGAVYARNGRVTLEDGSFVGNAADVGAGFDLGGGRLSAIGTRFEDHLGTTASVVWVHGGGDVTCDGCVFLGNGSSGDGGVAIVGAGST